MNQKAITLLAAVMATILEMETETPDPSPDGVPASSIYLALGHELSVYQMVTNIGQRMGWLRVSGETLALTPVGRERAKAFAVAFK